MQTAAIPLRRIVLRIGEGIDVPLLLLLRVPEAVQLKQRLRLLVGQALA